MPKEASIQERADASYVNFEAGWKERVALAADYRAPEDEREDADQAIGECPLAVTKLVTNHRDESVQYEILLGTGGPARRILVTTDYHGEVDGADYQFQDWFEPWTSAEGQDEEFLMNFARRFYYEPVPEEV